MSTCHRAIAPSCIVSGCACTLDLATLRSEFPILSTSTYMISNSLGAMPRGVEASLQRVRDDVGDSRRACVGGSMVDDGQGSGRCGRADHRGAGRQRQHVRERHRRPHVGAVDAAAASHARYHRVLGGRLSVDDLPVPCAGGARLPPRDRPGQRRRQRGCRTHRRGHRRPHRAGGGLARAVSLVVHSRPGAHRRARQARRRTGRARSVPGRRHHPRRRQRARRRLCRRRMSQVAVRRTWQRVPLHATRSPCAVRPRFTGWASHPQPFAFDVDDYEPPADHRRMQTGTPAIPAYYAALARSRTARRRSASTRSAPSRSS